MRPSEGRFEIPVALPDGGEAAVSAVWDGLPGASAILALAPGAGAPLDHPFLAGFAAATAAVGIAVLRFNFPYQEGGRRPPDREPVLRATWEAVAELARSEAGQRPFVAGGKSLGGRIASLVVADGGFAPRGLVFLGYPLHPPGHPERMRDAHLDRIACRMLFLQGTRDPFARPDLLWTVLDRLGPRADLVAIPDADHSFHVRGTPRDPAADGAGLVATVAGFVRALAEAI